MVCDPVIKFSKGSKSFLVPLVKARIQQIQPEIQPVLEEKNLMLKGQSFPLTLNLPVVQGYIAECLKKPIRKILQTVAFIKSSLTFQIFI